MIICLGPATVHSLTILACETFFTNYSTACNAVNYSLRPSLFKLDLVKTEVLAPVRSGGLVDNRQTLDGAFRLGGLLTYAGIAVAQERIRIAWAGARRSGRRC